MSSFKQKCSNSGFASVEKGGDVTDVLRQLAVTQPIIQHAETAGNGEGWTLPAGDHRPCFVYSLILSCLFSRSTLRSRYWVWMVLQWPISSTNSLDKTPCWREGAICGDYAAAFRDRRLEWLQSNKVITHFKKTGHSDPKCRIYCRTVVFHCSFFCVLIN